MSLDRRLTRLEQRFPPTPPARVELSYLQRVQGLGYLLRRLHQRTGAEMTPATASLLAKIDAENTEAGAFDLLAQVAEVMPT